jgi:dolichol-phosphate mannosyltransferase
VPERARASAIDERSVRDLAPILVFIPTYNEGENVERTGTAIRDLGLDVDVLFVDDSSPDGTGDILDEMARRDPRLTVIHRPAKLGIGSAHVRGIQWAYDHGYRTLITMDCDLSHQVEDLPRFLAAADACEVVVGSRYLVQESLQEWNPFRRTLTSVAHLMTRHLLGIEYDATGAYRLYRLDRIPREAFAAVRAVGYSFFFESLYLLHASGFTVREVPIRLPARTYGHSKMGLRDIARSVWELTRLSLARRGQARVLPRNGEPAR